MEEYIKIKDDVNHTRIIRFLESFHEELEF